MAGWKPRTAVPVEEAPVPAAAGWRPASAVPVEGDTFGTVRGAPVGSVYGADEQGRRFAVPPTSTNADPRAPDPAFYVDPARPRGPATIGAPTDPNPRESPMRVIPEYRPGGAMGRLDAAAYEVIPFWRNVVRSQIAADYRRERGAEPPDSYLDARAQEVLGQAGEDYPGAKLFGQVAPLAIPQSKARTIAGAAARVLPWAGYSGLMAAGKSEDPTISGKLIEGAKAAGTTALLGAGVEGAFRAAPALDAASLAAQRRAIAGNVSPLAVREMIPDESIRIARDVVKPVKFGSTPVGIAERLAQARETAGQEIGDLTTRMAGKGVEGPSPRGLAMSLEDAAAARAAKTMDHPEPGFLRGDAESLWPVAEEKAAQAKINAWPTPIQQAQKQAQDEVAKLDAQLAAQGVPPALRQTFIQAQMRRFNPTIVPPPPMPALASRKPTLPSGNLSLEQALGMERGAREIAQDEYSKIEDRVSALGRAKKKAAGITNAEVDKAIAAQAGKAPEEAAAWLPANRKFGAIKDSEMAAHEAATRYSRQKSFGLPEMLGLTGTAATAISTGGDVKKIASAAALTGLMHLLRTRGASSAAALETGAFRIADFLKLPPEEQEAVLRLYPYLAARAGEDRR